MKLVLNVRALGCVLMCSFPRQDVFPLDKPGCWCMRLLVGSNSFIPCASISATESKLTGSFLILAPTGVGAKPAGRLCCRAEECDWCHPRALDSGRVSGLSFTLSLLALLSLILIIESS